MREAQRLMNLALRGAAGKGYVNEAPWENVDEFLTYALTDRGFQELLASIPAPRSGSLLDRFFAFVERVMRRLGVITGSPEHTVLRRIIARAAHIASGTSLSCLHHSWHRRQPMQW